MHGPRPITLLIAPVASALDGLRNVASFPATLRQVLGLASGSVRAIGFWAAVSLPLIHVALLLRGLESSTDLLAFAALLGANLLALLVGHGYGSQ